MLTMKEKIIVEKYVDVLNIKTFKSSESKRVQSLPCSTCKQSIGNRDWGLAWIRKQNGKERGVRLCYDCLIKAKKDFAEETGCPVCNMQLRGIEELRYCENCGWTTEGDS